MEKDKGNTTDKASLNYDFLQETFHVNMTEMERESNKIGLDTFAFEFKNVLDDPLDKTIKESEKEIVQISNKIKELNIQIEKLPKEPINQEEYIQSPRDKLNEDIYYLIEDQTFIYDQLFAILEMKIIYSFKYLEINIKKLIKAAYQDKDALKRYRWVDLKQFLNSKGVNLKKVEYYSEINELRELNNSLKHSDDLSDFKIIKEIRESEIITYESLKKFYDRIKKCPSEFLSSLAYSIYKDLYEFDEKRLKEIARSLALRIDNKDSKVFIEAFKYFYK